MGIFDRFTNRLPIIWSFLLVGFGLYLYRIDLKENFLFGIILLVASSISMFIVLGVWRSFTENYADEIIHWTSEKTLVRKLVAGGSLSYYEYQEDVHKVGPLEPIIRFLNLMIAFIGLSTTFANLLNLKPSDPLANLNSVLVWSFLIFLVPIILTPIVPIIWAMEDLKLKAWNEKHKTSWRISRRYKARFNSIIAVSTLGVAFGLSREKGIGILENLSNFIILLLEGIKILTYPIAVLTLLYYLYFRGKTIDKVKSNLDLPVAKTKIVLLDKHGSEIVDDIEKEKITTEDDREQKLDRETDTEEDRGKSIVNKIGDGAKNAVQKTGEKIVDTGKGIVSGVSSVGKSINDNTIGRISDKFKSKKQKKGGSATEGLWDAEENENQLKKNKKDGSN